LRSNQWCSTNAHQQAVWTHPWRQGGHVVGVPHGLLDSCRPRATCRRHQRQLRKGSLERRTFWRLPRRVSWSYPNESFANMAVSTSAEPSLTLALVAAT
jgi:hypothetical protein